jgi:hypothetical protein
VQPLSTTMDSEITPSKERHEVGDRGFLDALMDARARTRS